MAKEKQEKERDLNNKFLYNGNESEYDFQLKKKPNLWWLLLLLLPLVLLIPLKKDIAVYTKLDGNPEPYIDVNMKYTARYLLWDKKFMAKVPYDTIQQTDSIGSTVFKGVGYSIFSFIFHYKTPVVFSAGEGLCFDSITMECCFHTAREVVLDMSPQIADVRLKVVDKELKFEIPGAKVECDYQGKNGLKQMVDTTEASGCVVIKEARVCGGFNSIKVSADGYADTLLTNLQVTEMLKEAGGYVIPLRPLKERFIFYVKNVYTKEPVPDAFAEVALTLNGQQGSLSKLRTNVDGLGQGFFDNARVLATIGIKVSKQGYYDSVYVVPKGKPNPITVRDFVKLDSADRVVWLRPKPHTEQFRNVDTLSNQPIVGVRNEIVVNGIDGSTRTYVATSNRNGYFDVTALPGDKITIKSTLDPYYHPKTTVIDKFDKAQIIYMHPVLVDLTFRTVEINDGKFKGVLPDCKLVITVDGKKVDPTNSGSGIFTVPKVRLSSKISIVASKSDYGSNRSKINNKSVEWLSKAGQDERDIPLQKKTEPEPPKENCGVHFSGLILSDEASNVGISRIFDNDPGGEYVGSGYYPDNTKAFPNAVDKTFDAIAVDNGTHLILYSQPNFKGKVLLDVVGPILISNVLWKDDIRYNSVAYKTFTPDLQALFPVSRRQWSSENMHDWSTGSCKIICEN